jgi:hypothetical protein
MRENSAAVQQSQGEARKQFFFEKKNQKTSIHWSPVARRWHTPNG